MDDHLTLITNRRAEVLKIISEAEKALSDGKAELAELDVTGRTLARLTGASWPPTGQEDSTSASPPSVGAPVQPDEKPVTELILSVIRMPEVLSYIEMMDGIAPKEVRAEIKRRFDKDVRGEYVSTQMWRMADKGVLKQSGKGRYRLPGS